MFKRRKTKENEPSRKGRLFFTGFSMGLADLVPGVSGGTIALLYGVYDELLYAIKKVTGDFLKLIFKKRFKEAFKVVPFEFLLPLAAGIATAIIGLIKVFSYLLETYPAFVWSTFFGLVIGSSYLVAKRIEKWNANRYLLLIVGFIATYFLVGISGSSADPSNLNIFTSGAIASSALVLPGISGSLMLVLLGQYENIITAAGSLELEILTVFITGALLGIALFSRLLSWLLNKHHAGTIALLVGVMLGSLRRIWPWQKIHDDHTFTNILPDYNFQLLISLALMALGLVVVWQLEKIGIAKEHIDIEDQEYQKEVLTRQD